MAGKLLMPAGGLCSLGSCFGASGILSRELSELLFELIGFRLLFGLSALGSGGKESGGGLLSSLSEDLLLLLEPNLKKDGAWFCFLLGFLESWVEIEVESGSVVLLGALWITLASTGTGGGLL